MEFVLELPEVVELLYIPIACNVFVPAIPSTVSPFLDWNHFQYSLSDDQKNLECNEPFNIHIQDVILKAGAEFIVIITGKIMTMPGLPKVPAAESSRCRQQ